MVKQFYKGWYYSNIAGLLYYCEGHDRATGHPILSRVNQFGQIVDFEVEPQNYSKFRAFDYNTKV